MQRNEKNYEMNVVEGEKEDLRERSTCILRRESETVVPNHPFLTLIIRNE